MNQTYFNRVAAIEFAVRYDDGKDPRGFKDADLVLPGISRTSKTPLSMYLANHNLKVANLPLLPEVPIPKEIYDELSEIDKTDYILQNLPNYNNIRSLIEKLKKNIAKTLRAG